MAFEAELADLRSDIVQAVEIASARPLDDEQLVALAQRFEPLRFERFADGKLLVTPLAGLYSGVRSAKLTAQIANWARGGDHGMVAGSRGGFNLPDGSLFAPNATFVARRRVIAPERERAFPVIVPDAVFEMFSKSDRGPTTMKKLRAYLRNGVALVVFIDPYRRRVYVGRTGIDLPAKVLCFGFGYNEAGWTRRRRGFRRSGR